MTIGDVPSIARDDLRQCLAGLIEKARARYFAATGPAHPARLGQLVRYLTQRLARRILTDAGRQVASRKARRV